MSLAMKIVIAIMSAAIVSGGLLPGANAKEQASSTVTLPVEKTVIGVDEVVFSRCDTQDVYFSGTATYDVTDKSLKVTLDGTTILESDDQAYVWIAPAANVTAGSHRLEAAILKANGEVTAKVPYNFTVPNCDSGSSNGGNNSNGRSGGDSDCCPGPDPVVKKSSKVARVKGIATTGKGSLWDRLKPLNSLFRAVYGRTPTLLEWQYWAGRLLNDKPQHRALIGAMQWHKLQGLTIGR